VLLSVLLPVILLLLTFLESMICLESLVLLPSLLLQMFPTFVASLLLLLYLRVVGVPAVAYVPCCLRPYIPILAILLLLASRDVPVFYCAAVVPAVSVVLSDIDVEPQLWLESLPAALSIFLTSLLFLSYLLLLASLLLLTYLLPMMFPLMLVSSYVPGVSVADFGPALAVILSDVVPSLGTLLWLELFLLLLSLLMLLTFLGSRSC
jgi:hypothetical protein